MYPDAVLGHDEARRFYDRLGRGQDWGSRWFEDPATRELAERAELADATAVLEFGCGTGRFAAALLRERLPGTARYLAFDQSDTMVRLASGALAPFAPRARVQRTDGSTRLPAPDASVDRFFANYVLDLLSEDDIRALLAEVRRVLRPGGLLCLASLSTGCGPLSRAFARLWRAVHALRPAAVGGCRPIELAALLAPDAWEIRHAKQRATLAVPSGLVVARRRPD